MASRHVTARPQKPVKMACARRGQSQNGQKMAKKGGGNGDFESVLWGQNAHSSGTLFAAKGPWPPTPPEKLRQSGTVVLIVSIIRDSVGDWNSVTKWGSERGRKTRFFLHGLLGAISFKFAVSILYGVPETATASLCRVFAKNLSFF